MLLAAGLTGWDAGPIENSVVLEDLVSVLININKLYGSTHAGIKITGVSKIIHRMHLSHMEEPEK